jgi:hypothetical protein
MPDLVLPALARTLAQYVPGVGHVYDQTDDDPTPDSLSLPNGAPVIGFIDPYQGDYDTGAGDGDSRGATFGFSGHTSDRSTVLVIVFIAPLQVMKAGRAQRLARPFARYLIKDAVRQHNTLGGVVWKATARRFEAGPFAWGSDVPNWYVVRIPVEITDDRQVTPGS